MKKIIILFVFLPLGYLLFAQTNISLPMDDPAYRLLEIAEIKGLIKPLPKVRPLSRKAVLDAINEMENAPNSKLLDTEKSIIKDVRERLSTSLKSGLNLKYGTFRSEGNVKGVPLSMEAGFGIDLSLSGGFYFEKNDFYPSFEFRPHIKFSGDIGEQFSYGAAINGIIMYTNNYENGDYYANIITKKEIKTMGVPPAYFPYTYRKKWDGTVWNIKKITNADFIEWPQDFSIGYGTATEISGTFVHDIISYRFGRIDREYGAATDGYSLTLNKNAQPFYAIEFGVHPFSWFSFSNMVGILEFSGGSQKDSAKADQSAFSLSQIEFFFKNYVYFGFGSTVVWPKRFELAYLFPIIIYHAYQMNIGDFDNTGNFANLKLQWPGVGNIWGSVFLDEINPEAHIFELDRALYSYQAGAEIIIPRLPFASVKLSYTKIEPYCFTHPMIETPWYSNEVSSAYMSHGEPLGYFLKPNSDEIKVLFAFMPLHNLSLSASYQMRRHGADYGSSQVDGSSYFSELNGSGREWDGEKALRKNFLHDGSYEWSHIIHIAGELSIPKTSVKLFAETGLVISYFTNITEGASNDGYSHPIKRIDTAEYPKSTGVILTLGVHVLN
ncbi:MAG: hypothetical protein Ta2G_17200 [Termitinemataceae bacterium]|nr:MAG: hypothetical protein Ta2G_17200 [Termitinemataceae bacterium]